MVYDDTVPLLLLLRAMQSLFLNLLSPRSFPAGGVSGRIIETRRPLLTEVGGVGDVPSQDYLTYLTYSPSIPPQKVSTF